MSETITNTVSEKTLTRTGRGLTQSERQLEAMKSAFYAIEERTFSEWMAYLREAARYIAFYDSQTVEITDTWASALPTQTEAKGLQTLLAGGLVSEEITTLASRPDIAALLAFFSLMSYPKTQFADFTEVHKQHYYQTVLGFSPKESSPDQVNLVLTLSDSVSSMTLPAGTQFNGGSDANDEPLIYETLTNAVLNHAQVTRLDTLSGISDNQRVLTKHIDTDNGLELSEDGALTFGDEVTLESDLTDQQSFNQTGFTLASPSLYLSGGERTIKLNFERAQNAEDTPLMLQTWFDIAVSTAEGMVLLDDTLEMAEAPAWSLEENATKDSETYDLILSFSALFPAINGLEGDLDPGIPSLPYVRFLLKSEYRTAAKILTKRVFETLAMEVEVTDLTGVVAENQNGALDTSGPVEPFSLQPAIGSRFRFTHPELLVKSIVTASVTLDWLGRPKDLADYYAAYLEYRQTLDPELGEWLPPMLIQGRSDSITPLESQSMFGDDDSISQNIDSHTIPFVQQEGESYPNGTTYDWADLPLTEGAASQWPKYYSLTLTQNDFGHGDVSQVNQYIAYQNTKGLQADTDGSFVPKQVMTPYTPLLNSIRISYRSSASIAMSTLDTLDPPLLQHVHPIGRPAVAAKTYIAFLPALAESAYLYIGLAQVSTPGQVRLYFQIDPVDGTNISDDYFVDWRYLTASGFQSIPSSSVGAQSGSARILEDSTQQLLNSGVIVIELPELDSELSALGDNLLWLQVSIYNSGTTPVTYSKIKGVYSQGVVAELVSDGVDATHFAEPLAASSVTELVEANPKISDVAQPWPSFGASLEETETQLSIRASERLRHKQRALTVWDYEHLVLNAFPEVYLARCYVPDSSTSDADIELMLVPVNYDTSILQPKLPLYLHERIQTFIGSVCPPGLEIKVRDPNYEEVTFDVALKIYSGNDIDSVVSDLNQQLIDYLTPWQSSVSSSVRFRQSIHLTALAAMLEQDDAVDVVYYLKATVTSDGVDTLYDSTNNVLEPSDNTAILVPSKNQKITLVDQDVAIVAGIGKWRVEIDFVVS